MLAALCWMIAAAAAPADLPDDATPIGAVTSDQTNSLGTTLHLKLRNGPFPCDAPGCDAKAAYTDRTALVFVPRYLSAKRSIDVVVHFHGHDGTALAKIAEHQLREQVAASGKNVVLVVPQGPVNAADSSGGQLELAGGFARVIYELQSLLRKRGAAKGLGAAVVGATVSIGRVALSAHSGGYRVVGAILAQGGVPISEVYLFDALYGDVPKFRQWLAQPSGKRLVSWFNKGAPRQLNEILMNRLAEDGVDFAVERTEGALPPQRFARSPAVFVHTEVAHSQIPWLHNNLRDALATSAFAWAKGAPRPDVGPPRKPRLITLRQ